MKIGLVGAGFMGRTHLAGWRSIGEEVVGLLRFDDPTIAELAVAEGLSVFDNVPDMATRCDVIDVCSPTFTHRDYVLAAVAAGTPIFCEKPLALSVEDGVSMVRAAEDAGVPLGVGHVLRYFPEYAAAARTVRSGDLGDPAVLRFSRCTFAPKNAWYLDESRSGGVILDLMIHDLDFARHVGGDVKRVFASIDRGSDVSGRLAPHAHALLTHTSGAISHVEGSWRMPQPEFLTSFEIAGSKALLIFDSRDTSSVSPIIGSIQRPLVAEATTAGPTTSGSEGPGRVGAGDSDSAEMPDIPVAASPVSEDPYALELLAFRNALRTGNPPPVDGREGLFAIQIALAAQRSARTGTPVDIEPLEVAR